MKATQVTIAALAIASAGCGGTVLTRTDRTKVEGKLVDSDAERKAVQLRFDDGTEQWIPLDTVAEADRPGTYMMLLGAGGLVSGFAYLILASNISGDPIGLSGDFQVAGIASLVIGGVAMISGFGSWSNADGHLKQAGWERR